MRGEHAISALATRSASRKFPHARETLLSSPTGLDPNPPIPACAGNTCPAYRTLQCPPAHPAYAETLFGAQLGATTCLAHPRVRGEHVVHRPATYSLTRSSRACGKHAGHLIFSISRPPLIPTYAGNTEARRCPRRGEPAHSRMRGEHSPRSTCFAVMPRLSPHARGTLIWRVRR